MSTLHSAEPSDVENSSALSPSERSALARTAAVFVVLLVGAGALMWTLQGEAVFLELVDSVLAWCM